MPHYIVESIEFDFSDSMGTTTFEALPKPPEEEQKFITENTLGVWFVDDEDELLEKISNTTGWLVSSCRYVPNQPHPLTSYV